MPTPDDIPYVSQVKRLTSIDEIEEVPVIGNLYNAANVVIDYFESDCHPDWHVYIETLFPALGEVVLVLLTFGLDDVLRGYLRPAGARGFGGLGRASRRPRRATRAARARGRLRGGIPEIGELLGRHLPGAEIVRGRPVGGAERFLWRVDGLAQRGLWYWMIADIAEDFTINWTSALYRSDECIGIDVAGMVRFEEIQAIPEAPSFTNVNIGTVVDEWGILTHTSTGVSCPSGMTGVITYEGRIEPGNDPIGDYELALRITNGGAQRIIYSGDPGQNPETGALEYSIAAHLNPGDLIEWGGRNTGNTVTRWDATATALFRAIQ